MEYLSYEPEVQRKAYKDPVFLKNDKVLNNLLKLEMQYLPSSKYMKAVQTDIQVGMRKMLAQWMLEVCQEQLREPEVFLLAVNYLDRFLTFTPMKRTRLQLLGTACMFLASKLKESLPIESDKLVLYTDNSISLQDLLDYEMLVLVKLRWDLSAITPSDFLDLLLARLDISDEEAEKIRVHAQTFIFLCAVEYQFLAHPPSMIASASVTTVAKAFCTPEVYRSICECIHRVTKIDLELLHSVEDQIAQAMDSTLLPTSPQPQSPPTTPTDVVDVHLSS